MSEEKPPEHVAYMVIYSSVYSATEVANLVNQRFGTDYSAQGVGYVLSDVESQVNAANDPAKEIGNIIARGLLAEIGAGMMANL